MERTCPECGDLYSGRVDKRFCCDQCRTSHNNKLNKDDISYVRNINNILRKNRRILMDLNPGGKTKIHKSKMEAKGFNFDYITNLYSTKNGNVYHFCYEVGYLKLEEGYFALVKKQEYMQ